MKPNFWTRRDLHKAMWGKKIYGKDDCPFCFPQQEDNERLWNGEYWSIFYNKYPYSWNDQHLMAVPNKHKHFSHELTHDELSELSTVYAFMHDYFWDNHYFSFTRESFANRSVEHLHIHFLVGKLQGRFLRKMLELQGYPIVEDLRI